MPLRDLLGRHALQVGDHVRLEGGYDPAPAWLAGRDSIVGSVIAFIAGQNAAPAAVVQLAEPLELPNGSGGFLVLELRYAGAGWTPSGVVHLELLSTQPDDRAWSERRRTGDAGQWLDSHVTYTRVT